MTGETMAQILWALAMFFCSGVFFAAGGWCVWLAFRDGQKRGKEDALPFRANDCLLYTSWVPANLDEIMRRANQLLKDRGQPQMGNKPEWIIP